ncbi:hypothetical protein [Taklimakanibacter deserti]|uniref:hypothetical protein n=1 Tax=Taklimakanibacter deserti TaxID=2267839 RepID=UPI000E64F721
MDTSTTIGLGHNQGPQTIADDLADRFKPLLDRYAELTESGAALPETIDDDETHGKVMELVKSMRALKKSLEDTMDAERAPFKQKVEAISGWFKSRIDPLVKLKDDLTARHKDYSDRKAAAEKQRLEEEAEKKRAAEREALRLAQEAQAAAAASDQAAETARILADEAKSQREAATTDLEVATADHADARAKAGALWAKLLEIDADVAKRRKAGETFTPEQIAGMKGDLPDQYKDARALVADADDRVKEARAIAAEAKKRQKDADRKAEEEKRAAAQANRQVQSHLGDAVRLDKAATKFENRAAGPDADLARARSEHGAVGTVTRQWKSEVVDRDKLDKYALWPFIHGDAISAALWKWMQTQPPEKRVMPGARMTEETIGTVR